MKELPLVSCVIPTYKRSELVLRAVRSALQQTYHNIEVLVIDDNETNDEHSVATQKNISNLGDSRVRYVIPQKHINGAAARNAGIKNAIGKYIAFLDDDDEWMPEKLEKQVYLLEGNAASGGCICYYTIVNNGTPIRKCFPYTQDGMLLKILNREVQVFTSTVLVKKQAVCDAGLFDESLQRHQDLQLLADIAAKYKILVLSEYLVFLHTESAMNRPNIQKEIESKNRYLQTMQRHLTTFTKKEQRLVYNAHNFEIVFHALKARQLRIALRYLWKIGPNVSAYKAVYDRYLARRTRKL